MNCVGKLLLSLPLHFYIHRLEEIVLVDGSIQALHCRQVLRRKMVQELCLGDQLLQVFEVQQPLVGEVDVVWIVAREGMVGRMEGDCCGEAIAARGGRCQIWGCHPMQ